jgi:hypothetical protein
LPDEVVTPERITDGWRTDPPKVLKERKRMMPEEQKHIQFEAGVAKRRAEHFDHLANIVSAFLINEIDTVMPSIDTVEPRIIRGDEYGRPKYTIGEQEVEITILELSLSLRANIQSVLLQFSPWDLTCLIYHLKAESPEIESKGFTDVVRENPYKLIDTLRVLAWRKTFKGTCPVCRDWQTPHSPS